MVGCKMISPHHFYPTNGGRPEDSSDAKWAEYNAKVSLANAFQSLYDGAYDTIMDKQNKYDSETEHGTIPDKQDEWNKKYE